MSNNCPHCWEELTKTSLNRLFKNMLYDFKLICPSHECKKEIKYENMILHIQKECPYIEIPCPHKCGTKA